MNRLAIGAMVLAALTTAAMAVSVGEVAGKCGDDARAYCQGIGYGDAMTDCLSKNRAKLRTECGEIVDRIKEGESVTLF